MNEELVRELLTRAIKGVDFVVGEIPEYVTQLMWWYATRSIIFSLIGLTLFGILTWVYFKFYVPAFKGWIVKSDNNPDTWAMVVFLSFLWAGFAMMVTGWLITLTWLQILIAPKVWLLEYAARLV